jgi:uncharacterized membrane protein YagU involved in acid resistance
MTKQTYKRSIVEEALAGAASGLLATVPMTLTMFIMQGMLPRRERTTLEPRRVSDDMLRKAGVNDDVSKQGRESFSVVAHLGYGATTGMFYALAQRLMPLPGGLRGPVYGLFVWAASYAGWLPAVNTLPPPHRRPVRRNLLLIVAHFVWGVALELAILLFSKTLLPHAAGRRR